MYTIDAFLDGIKYTVYFFSTFSGFSHPYTPEKPLSTDEIFLPDRKTFYQAWYRDIGSEPRLVILEKFWLTFEPAPQTYDAKKASGRYFNATQKVNNEWVIGQYFNVSELRAFDSFFTYTVDEQSKVTQANFVTKTLIDRYQYKYTADGLFESVDIEINDLPE